MKEKDFQRTFNHWLKNVYKGTGAFELKLCKGTSMPFSAVEEHQLDALLQAKYNTLVYKIPDAGYQNPFDCFSLSGVDAFVVVKFAAHFYGITIYDFIFLKENCGRKSLTEEMAKEKATFIG